MDVVIPLERLGVPPVEYVAYAQEAEMRYAADPTSRYHAAVAMTFRWISGITTTRPTGISGMTAEPTPDEMADETFRATDIVYGVSNPDGIAHDWALGVMTTLRWVRGRPRAQPPVRLTELRRAA